MLEGFPPGQSDESTVRRLWWAALDTLQYDIILPMRPPRGLWLASPLPALYETKLLDRLQGWVWTPDEFETLQSFSGSFLPPSQVISKTSCKSFRNNCYNRLSLKKEDGNDPFLLIITPEVQVAIALEGSEGRRNFLMRSDPQTLGDVLKLVDTRLSSDDPGQAIELRKELGNLGQLKINKDLEKFFWLRLSERLAQMAPSLTLQSNIDNSKAKNPVNDMHGELSLLEALTHEVRTPLATIRTLIRSILRRQDLPRQVYKRLRQIDDECTEQIDRFGLIFKAAELQRRPPDQSRLASTDLGSMLKILYPGWCQQLERRGVCLHLDVTPELPQVLSDPESLEPMLGGLIDRSSRGVPKGGTLSLQLRAAGSRLKLQIISKALNDQRNSAFEGHSKLGPVLSWNPNTGSLQLSQAATQQLLASLGGWLTHRRDSRLTVFFPIADGKH